MKSGTKSLLLGVLLGGCSLLTGGDLNASDPPTSSVALHLARKSDVPVAIVTDLQEPPGDVGPSIEVLPRVHPLHTPQPGPSVVATEPPQWAPQAIPLRHCPQEDAHEWIPPAHNGTLNTRTIISDHALLLEMAAQGAHGTRLHPAPEVVLRFSPGCTATEFTDWKLSSRDATRSSPAIPYGPIMVEVKIDIEPVDFVELMLDGAPLKPSDYSRLSPLRFQIPCPAAGWHYLQARFLSGNIWSVHSRPLGFKVRLPNRPRIISVSDFDREPTSPERNDLTSITTGVMKIRLANIGRGDHIVAYVDGKPITSAMTNELCCRTIQLSGLLTPGVHALVVRKLQCPTKCLITSQPSNPVMFHYYDERVYVLRPGTGCDNKRPGKTCLPTLHSASNSQCHNQALVALGLGEAEPGIHSAIISGGSVDVRQANGISGPRARFVGHNVDTSALQFVSFLQPNPAVNANKSAVQALKFSRLAQQEYATATKHMTDASNHASAAVNFSQAARADSDAAAADARRAKSVAAEAAQIHSTVSKMMQLPESAAAIRKAQLAATDASKAAVLAEQTQQNAASHAKLAESHAAVATNCADASKKPRDDAKRAWDQSAKYAKRAVAHAAAAKNLHANNKVVEARREELAAAAEHDRAEKALQHAKLMAKEAERFAKLTAGAKDQAKTARGKAKSERQKTGTALAQVLHSSSAAKSLRTAVISTNATTIAKGASAAYAEIKKISAAVPPSTATQAAVADSQKAVDAAKAAVDDAEYHARRAKGYLSSAAEALAAARTASRMANRAVDRANAYAKQEARCGDSARARVATTRSKLAAENAQQAGHWADAADQNYNHAEAVVADAETAAINAKSQLAAATRYRDLAKQELAYLLTARADVAQAVQDGAAATNRAEVARVKGDVLATIQARSDALVAERDARRRAQDILTYAKRTQQHATYASDRRQDAEIDAQRADDAADRASKFRAATDEAAKYAVNLKTLAERNAQDAGRVLEQEAAARNAWDNAEESAALAAAEANARSAELGDDEDGVRRAQEKAAAVRKLADHEWEKAAARIALAEANASATRARKVDGPPSPFIFASAAHFPLRGYGLKGEVVDGEGLIIYEDMKFAFDREGNYEVHFRATTPNMPTTVRLQFQIQPYDGGAWYTITLAPIELCYKDSRNCAAGCQARSTGSDAEDRDEEKECCGDVHKCVCRGHSEVLRRCYGEMGQNARIRRGGTARFGFGVNVP